jgi:hypothetical protein
MSAPRIALLDIETAPSLGYFWGRMWETNILDVKSQWYILCFSYKWLGEKTIHTHSLPDYTGYSKNKEDDRRLTGDLWTMLDEADIVIAHNGDQFDLKKTNARLIANGYKPPSMYKSIDTLKIARRYFKFESNKLADLGPYLNIGKKLPHTGFNMWLGCIRGDKAAWKMMEDYNRHDVELLEKVYYELRPWATNHPDLTLYTDSPGCPTCQSKHVTKQGFSIKRSKKYQQYQCQGCGHWFHGSRSD